MSTTSAWTPQEIVRRAEDIQFRRAEKFWAKVNNRLVNIVLQPDNGGYNANSIRGWPNFVVFTEGLLSDYIYETGTIPLELRNSVPGQDYNKATTILKLTGLGSLLASQGWYVRLNENTLRVSIEMPPVGTDAKFQRVDQWAAPNPEFARPGLGRNPGAPGVMRVMQDQIRYWREAGINPGPMDPIPNIDEILNAPPDADPFPNVD